MMRIFIVLYLILISLVSASITRKRTFKILWFSDIHLDLYYGSPGAFGAAYCANAGQVVATYGCDVSQVMIQYLAQIQMLHEHDGLLMTGNLLRHNLSGIPGGDISKAYNDTVRYIFRTLKKETAFAFALGEQDLSPSYFFNWTQPVGSYERTHFALETLSDVMSSENFFQPNHANQFRKFGFYAMEVVDYPLTFINLNTVLLSRRLQPGSAEEAKFTNSSNKDPENQLQWLRNELELVKHSNRWAIITGNIPPGIRFSPNSWKYSDFYDAFQLNDLGEILLNYSSVISAQLFGHTHHAHFRLFQDRVIFGSGSVSPLYYNNPSCSTVEINVFDGSVVDWEMHVLYLTNSSETNIQIGTQILPAHTFFTFDVIKLWYTWLPHMESTFWTFVQLMWDADSLRVTAPSATDGHGIKIDPDQYGQSFTLQDMLPTLDAKKMFVCHYLTQTSGLKQTTCAGSCPPLFEIDMEINPVVTIIRARPLWMFTQVIKVLMLLGMMIQICLRARRRKTDVVNGGFVYSPMTSSFVDPPSEMDFSRQTSDFVSMTGMESCPLLNTAESSHGFSLQRKSIASKISSLVTFVEELETKKARLEKIRSSARGCFFSLVICGGLALAETLSYLTRPKAQLCWYEVVAQLSSFTIPVLLVLYFLHVLVTYVEQCFVLQDVQKAIDTNLIKIEKLQNESSESVNPMNVGCTVNLDNIVPEFSMMSKKKTARQESRKETDDDDDDIGQHEENERLLADGQELEETSKENNKKEVQKTTTAKSNKEKNATHNVSDIKIAKVVKKGEEDIEGKRMKNRKGEAKKICCCSQELMHKVHHYIGSFAEVSRPWIIITVFLSFWKSIIFATTQDVYLADWIMYVEIYHVVFSLVLTYFTGKLHSVIHEEGEFFRVFQRQFVLSLMDVLKNFRIVVEDFHAVDFGDAHRHKKKNNNNNDNEMLRQPRGSLTELDHKLSVLDAAAKKIYNFPKAFLRREGKHTANTITSQEVAKSVLRRVRRLHSIASIESSVKRLVAQLYEEIKGNDFSSSTAVGGMNVKSPTADCFHTFLKVEQEFHREVEADLGLALHWTLLFKEFAVVAVFTLLSIVSAMLTLYASTITASIFAALNTQNFSNVDMLTILILKYDLMRAIVILVAGELTLTIAQQQLEMYSLAIIPDFIQLFAVFLYLVASPGAGSLLGSYLALSLLVTQSLTLLGSVQIFWIWNKERAKTISVSTAMAAAGGGSTASSPLSPGSSLFEDCHSPLWIIKETDAMASSQKLSATGGNVKQRPAWYITGKQFVVKILLILLLFGSLLLGFLVLMAQDPMKSYPHVDFAIYVFLIIAGVVHVFFWLPLWIEKMTGNTYFTKIRGTTQESQLFTASINVELLNRLVAILMWYLMLRLWLSVRSDNTVGFSTITAATLAWQRLSPLPDRIKELYRKSIEDVFQPSVLLASNLDDNEENDR